MTDRKQPNSYDEASSPAAAARHRRTDLVLFSILAGLWGAGLGTALGWGNLFVTGKGYLAVVTILAVSAFTGATLSHLLFQAQRGYLRSLLAGGGIALLGTLSGALMTGWGRWAPLALQEFDLVGPLLILPSAIYGLAYRAARNLNQNRRHLKEERPFR